MDLQWAFILDHILLLLINLLFTGNDELHISGQSSTNNILKQIKMLETMFVPTYHHLITLKYKFIIKHPIEKKDIHLQRLKSKFCREILPALHRLEGGEVSKIKGEVLRELAKSELAILAFDLHQKKINKDDYMKNLKPYLALQLKACKIINTYGNGLVNKKR